MQLHGSHLFRRELLVHLHHFVQQFAAPELVRDAGGGQLRASVFRRPGELLFGVSGSLLLMFVLLPYFSH